MASLLTEYRIQQKYKTGLENISQWKSGEAMNTPVARKVTENKDLLSQVLMGSKLHAVNLEIVHIYNTLLI